MYRQDDDKATVQEVFGPATAFQFVDTLDNVKLSTHSLSMGINVDIHDNRESLLDFLKTKDLKYLPAIINIGYNASTLAATPTGEAFIPWHYTLSGQDTGMGPHSPLRYSSFQLSEEEIAHNVSQCKGMYYHNVCQDAAGKSKSKSKSKSVYFSISLFLYSGVLVASYVPCGVLH